MEPRPGRRLSVSEARAKKLKKHCVTTSDAGASTPFDSPAATLGTEGTGAPDWGLEAMAFQCHSEV